MIPWAIMRYLLTIGFYIRQCFVQRPAPAFAMTLSSLTFAGLLIANLFVRSEGRDLAAFTAKVRHGTVKPKAVEAVPNTVAIDLPPFGASALVKNFTSLAEEIHVPIDEITYAMESTNDKPYRRYRISLTTKAGYGELRKFVAGLAAEMPNLILDSIHCTRPDLADTALGCELTLSAYFRRGRDV